VRDAAPGDRLARRASIRRPPERHRAPRAGGTRPEMDLSVRRFPRRHSRRAA
jgi:hypothetical protein